METITNTLTIKVRDYLNHAEDRPFLKGLDGACLLSLHELRNRQSVLSDILNKTLSHLDRKAVIGIAINANQSWMVGNVASILSGMATLPVPTEFSDEQIKGLLQKVDVCLVDSTDMAQRLERIFPEKPILSVVDFSWYKEYRENLEPVTLDNNIVSIIHTSGTTSNPKGVLIRDEGIASLIDSLLTTLNHIGEIHYYSLVPFSLLIEQVLAFYLPLLSGGSVVLKPSNLPDFSYQSGLAQQYLHRIRESKANCVFLPPKLVEELGAMAEPKEFSASTFFGDSIPHLLTGGAKVSSKILEKLDEKGIRIYEGYGLSENSSVVSLNTPGSRKIGTAGKLLPHVKAKFINGELLISGDSLCAGYLGVDTSVCKFDSDGYLFTGDIGHIDKNGYLCISGRKKNIIILSNTRNVCPEWVEQIYKSGGGIDDIVVYGEGKESLSAAVFMNSNNLTVDQIRSEMKKQDHNLPAFSRVKDINVVVGQEWRSKFFTLTGRPKRQSIEIYFS